MSHQIPGDLPNKLEDQRKRVILFIEKNRPQGSLRNKVTVVFDGKSEFYGQMISSTVKIIFSQDETADDKIKRMVEQAEHKKNIVVVTNDKGIHCIVGRLGVKISSVQEFLNIRSFSSGKGKAILSSEQDEKISKNIECDITEEMKKIWLKGRL